MIIRIILLLGCSLGIGVSGTFDSYSEKPTPVGNKYNKKSGHGTYGTSQLDKLGEPWSSKMKRGDDASNKYNNGRGLQNSCSQVSSGRCTTLDGKRTFKESWAWEEPKVKETYWEDTWVDIPSTRVRYIKHHGLRVNPDIIDRQYSDDPRLRHRYGTRHHY